MPKYKNKFQLDDVRRVPQEKMQKDQNQIHQISKYQNLSERRVRSIGKDMENECCMQLYNITIGGSLRVFGPPCYRATKHRNPEIRLRSSPRQCQCCSTNIKCASSLPFSKPLRLSQERTQKHVETRCSGCDGTTRFQAQDRTCQTRKTKDLLSCIYEHFFIYSFMCFQNVLFIHSFVDLL